MKVWKFTMCAAAIALMGGPLADVTLAQRGERSGERSDRGGDGRSFSGSRPSGGGGENRSRQSFSGGRAVSGNAERGRNRGESARRSTQNQQDMRRGRPTSQRSYYRGPDGAQFDIRRSERSQSQRTRDFDRARDFERDQLDRRTMTRSDQREFPQGFDRDRREPFRSDRFYAELERREQLSDRERRDRDQWDSDRDRPSNQWYPDRDRSRYGHDDWRWRGDDVRRSWWRGFAGAAVPFRYGWWDNYYGASWPVYSPWRYARWQNRPYYWWGYTPAARLTDWFVFGWDRPRYWAYGPGANVYYRDNYVYYDGQRTLPVDDYYQQVYDLAHSVPHIREAEAETMDWAPLGVFAALRQGESVSQRALQLAVNRDGVLTGTYMNRSNGHVHPLSGMVDERTQRAAWAFADGQHEEVVFETGIYNLTRDEASMMVHFGPSADDTEVWQLVRLEQPESAAQQATAPHAATTRSLP